MPIGALLTCDDGGYEANDHRGWKGTYLVGRVREIRRLRRRVRVGAPDPSLTSVSGMAAVTELVDRLGVIGLLDAAIGPIKTRDRGHTGGELLVGMAAAQLAGEDFLVGLDRRRADTAGQVLAPVSGLCSTTAAGLARRLSDGQWQGGGDRGRRHPRGDARGAAGGPRGGAVRSGDDRPRHHRRGDIPRV